MLETFVTSVWQPDLLKHNTFFQNKVFDFSVGGAFSPTITSFDPSRCSLTSTHLMVALRSPGAVSLPVIDIYI